MPRSWTTNLGITKPADGEEDGVWGDIVNDNSDILDVAINGVLSLTLIGTTSTLTTSDGSVSNGQYKLLALGGAISGTHTITLSPNDADKIYFVQNNTSQNVVFTQGSGGNVTIAAGDSAIIYADGGGSTASVKNLTDHFAMNSVKITGGTISGISITGGSLDNTPIGATTPSTGVFTTLAGTTSLTSPSLTNAGTLALSATGANIITASTNGSERVRIDSSGRVLVGQTTSVAIGGSNQPLQVGASSAAGASFVRWAADIYGPEIRLLKSRSATPGSYTTVVDDDNLGSVAFYGDDGTSYAEKAASITTYVDGAVSTGVIPGRLTFSTTNTSGTSAERMRIHASGGVSIGNMTDPGATNLSVTGNLTVSSNLTVSGTYNGYTPAQNAPGQVAYFARNTAPTGWLKANGAAVSRTTYADLFAAIGTTFGSGNGTTTFNLPDLRGEFLRGWDDGRGVDSGRVFGSYQADAFKSHTHGIDARSGGDSADYVGTNKSNTNGTPNVSTEATGGTETRPRNYALLACIKY